jgi:3-methyladenine DNA glycosylase AlkD
MALSSIHADVVPREAGDMGKVAQDTSPMTSLRMISDASRSLNNVVHTDNNIAPSICYALPMTAHTVLTALKEAADPVKAAFFPRFFKTGRGQYGEGDVFLGVTVPKQRAIAKAYRALPLSEVSKLLEHELHEARLTGLLILDLQYAKGDEAAKKAVTQCYLSHVHRVNNWDLVDSSAPYILGQECIRRNDASILDEFAATDDLWKQRIAIISTYAFIRNGQYDHTLRIADKLLHHQHDLIHKAVGWMLREMGKKDKSALEGFLRQHCRHMPRTMLRYALEKFGREEREKYMKGTA